MTVSRSLVRRLRRRMIFWVKLRIRILRRSRWKKLGMGDWLSSRNFRFLHTAKIVIRETLSGLSIV